MIPEGRGLFPYLSVYDKLMTGAHLRRDRAAIQRDLEKVFAYVPVLKQQSGKPAKDFSGGEQQMIEIGPC